MKFCPKCGTQLQDEAKFCSKCGAVQPDYAPHEEVRPEPISIKEETPMIKPASPRERYSYLLKNDDFFRDTVKTIKKETLLSLINLLFLIPFFCSLFINVGQFTGVNVGDPSAAEVMNMMFPQGYSATSIKTYTELADAMGKQVTPGNGLAGTPIVFIVIVIGIFFAIFIILEGVIGKTKGYLLKTYESPDGKEKLLKEARHGPFLFGTMASIFAFSAPAATFGLSTGLDYKDKTYVYGQVEGLLGGLIAIIVITVITIAIMIAVQLVLANIFNKKLKKYKD